MDNLLKVFNPDTRLAGTYITVFRANDGHAVDYRDHLDKPLLVKNDRLKGTPDIFNATLSGDRVVSAKNDFLGMPGGQKELVIFIWPLEAKITITVEKDPHKNNVQGSALLRNPETGEIGTTIHMTGRKKVDNPTEADEQKFEILGRDLSGESRDLILTMRNEAGKTISYSWYQWEQFQKLYLPMNNPPFNEPLFSFTVFQVDQTAYSWGKVDDFLPESALAYGGYGPTTLRQVFRSKSMNPIGDLGNHVSDDATLAIYGGIVLQGQINPSGIVFVDFNLSHDRKNAFFWQQWITGRQYKRNTQTAPNFQLFYNIENIDTVQPYNAELLTYMASQHFSDTAGADYGKDVYVNPDKTFDDDSHLYIWAIDSPNMLREDIPNDGDQVLKRALFTDQVNYAGVAASNKLDWFWFGAVENPLGPVKVARLTEWEINGDNQVGLTSELNQLDLSKFLTPTLTQLDDFTTPALNNPCWSLPTIFPVQRNIPGQVMGQSLQSGSAGNTLVYFYTEDIYALDDFNYPTETRKWTVPLYDVQRSDTAISGKVSIGYGQRAISPYNLYLFSREKCVVGYNALRVP